MIINFLLGISVGGILLAFVLTFILSKKSKGKGRQLEIANLIKKSSFLYLREQYKLIAIISFIMFSFIHYKFKWKASFSFFVGVLSSTFAGFYNMFISVNNNVRTLEMAKDGIQPAFKMAIKSGFSASTFLSCLGLFSVSLIIKLFGINSICLTFLGLGASLVSVFARIGGGIFTKGADVGADLMGKVEKDLPEDDPRNPAVIADNVGDNVGDCAGMSADLMESLIVSLSTSIILLKDLKPIFIFSVGIVSCFLPVLFMKFKNVWLEINRLFQTSTMLFSFNLGIMRYFGYLNNPEVISISIGVLVVNIILKITEYYTSTSFRPVKDLAKSSCFGHGTNVINGLAISFESVTIPILATVLGIAGANSIMGIRGIAYAVIGGLGLLPVVLTLDIFGPISDNAGGLAEMSGVDAHIRVITDTLDEAGNTTKAITKGFAISSALFSCFVMFYLLQNDIFLLHKMNLVLSLKNPFLLFGLMVGGVIPSLVSAICIRAVGDAAEAVVSEIRYQIRNNPDILKGTQTPDYDSTISFLTRFSIIKMIPASFISIIITVLTYFSGYIVNKKIGLILLSGCVLGATIFGSFLSLMMTIAGGAWDNAKKYIESGSFGGKESEAYKAAVTGDTVGDPYKDTSGPALNSVIKLVNLVAILIIYL